MRKKTHEQFVAEVAGLVNDEYTVMGPYINSQSKILLRHNLCQTEYSITPDSFTSGARRCPACAMENKIARITRNRKDALTFKNDVYALTGDEYSVIGEYHNCHQKVMMRHSACGTEWEIRPNGFLKGNRCWKCSGLMPKTHSDFCAEVKTTAGDEYAVLGDYTRNHAKVLIKHKTCGYEWSVSPASFLQGTRCPKCGGVARVLFNDFRKLCGSEYTVLSDESEYKNCQSKLLIRHNMCGNKYMVAVKDFSAGTRCPACRFSKGEKTISSFLKSRKIPFKAQYKIAECKYKNPLPFDFAICNGRVLIEFDGEQHFRPVDYWGGADGFIVRQRNDKIKTDYCLTNGIVLVRIPYDTENIEQYLAGKINELNDGSFLVCQKGDG